MSNFIDSHCHLPDEAYADDLPEVLQRACEAGVIGMLAVGTSPSDWQSYLDLVAHGPQLRVALGFHPNSAKEYTPKTFERLRSLIDANRETVVALGEIGLDFYRDWATPEEQRPLLQVQLDLAAELDLPVVLHCRAAEKELIETLRRRNTEGKITVRGVWHSFTGQVEEARAAVELGLHVAFNGILTYPKAQNVRDAARMVPDDRLLLETDAPYLPPEPRRGKRNEPAYMLRTAERLAVERGTSLEEIARLTTENARRLFRVWPAP
jgi:TatD DNase family protein